MDLLFGYCVVDNVKYFSNYFKFEVVGTIL